MGKVQGEKIYLALAGSQVEGLVTRDFSQTVKTMEATTQDSNGNEEHLASDGGATFSFEGKFDASHTYGETQIRTAMDAKAAVAFVIGEGINTAGEQVLSGNCIITNLNKSAAHGDTMNFTCDCLVTGGVTEGTSATTLL